MRIQIRHRMKSIFVSILIVAFAPVSFPGFGQEIRLLENVVATYEVFQPDHSKDGNRILNLLLEEKIRAVTWVGNLAIITVADQDANRARKIVELAIRDENLRINLIGNAPIDQSAKSPDRSSKTTVLSPDGEKIHIVAVEVAESVEIYGGFAGYVSRNGAFVYQGIVSSVEEGHGLIEKRYVMNDALSIEWNRLHHRFSLLEVFDEKGGREIGVAGESEFTLKVIFSDGSVKERSGWSDDPTATICRYIQKRAWNRAVSSAPIILDYKREDFGNLARFAEKKLEQNDDADQIPRQIKSPLLFQQ